MNVLFSAFLMNSFDPGSSSRKIGIKPDPTGANPLATASVEQLVEYMYPWAETVRLIENCEKIVVHDGLPDTLQARFPWLTFVAPESNVVEVAWFKRFRLLRMYLRSREDIERLFICDINDVGVFRDPFVWMDQLELPRDMPIVSEEFCPVGQNPWFTSNYHLYPDEFRTLFEKLPEAVPVSAGLWGGCRHACLDILDSLVSDSDKYHDYFLQHRTVSWDMVSYNAAVMRRPYAAFNAVDLAPPHRLSGVTIRGFRNPFWHDRRTVLQRLAQENSPELDRIPVLQRVPGEENLWELSY